MKVLVKLGGTLVDDAESLERLARSVACLSRQGNRIVVVHGGGKQMTRFLAERGIESRFVDGLRVTTPEVIDALLKVFAGSVNHELVASLVAAGSPAVGLSGLDAGLAIAEQMDEALGAVGRIVRTQPEVLRVLVDAGFVPVVACVASDGAGRIFNVNADQMAVAIASGFAAERLIFLTDVEGVRDASGSVAPRLSVAESERLIAEGIATGGMQAKLNSAIAALRSGLNEVVIAAGSAPHMLERILAGEPAGTRLEAQ
ncbi:MAG: acetylglutamate kinase [Bryobacteraceae bacterium]|nr:acetylglutamate kinase [Bryobacteraceae bacterium]